MTVMIKDIPKDVNSFIKKEQMRLGLHEDQLLKKGAVICRMLREWYQLKNEHIVLKIRIKELEEKMSKS